jgi:tetratricopeptide (TPR) repeat protein
MPSNDVLPRSAASADGSAADWRAGVRPVLRALAGRLKGTAACREVENALAEPLCMARAAGCASALLDAGNVDDAELIYRALAGCAPTAPAGHVGLAKTAMRRQSWESAVERWDATIARFGKRALPSWIAAQAVARLRLGRAAEALNLLEACATALVGDAGVLQARLEAEIALRRLPAARATFAAAMERSLSEAAIEVLVDLTAQLFEGRARADTFLALLKKVDRPDPHRSDGVDRCAAALRLRLLLALRDYDGFLRAYDEIVHFSALGIHEPMLKAAAGALRRAPSLDYAAPKVFGIGLSRTGTTSLAAALRILGLSTAHWGNPLTMEVIGEDDFHLFDAFLDTPVCVNFERNYYTFPNSRFIYTIRNSVDWERSWTAYTRRRWLLSDYREMAKAMEKPDQFQYGRCFTDIHRCLYFNHGSYQDAFRAYDRRVRRFFADKPAERFIEFDLFGEDGWEKLCTFLERDVPAVTFPWNNRTPAGGEEGARSG